MRHFITAACLLVAACGQDHGSITSRGSSIVNVHVRSFRPAVSRYEGRVYVRHDAKVGLVREGGFLFTVKLPRGCATRPIRHRVGHDIQVRENFVRFTDGAVQRTITHADAIQAICRDIATRDPA